ncbi:MAG: carbamate kinase [bacterium]
MENKILIALGGNAIVGPGEEGNLEQQYRHTGETMAELATLLHETHFDGLILSHGNGPQVGNILLRSEYASEVIYPITLDVAVADSQAGMGYMIQQSLHNALARVGERRLVTTVITQVEVSRDDPAFATPTKFIGQSFPHKKAESLIRDRKWQMKLDRGRGWRRVVASPEPCVILEQVIIRKLLQEGVIVIAVGGGGIPVVREADGRLHGVEAVIDKDMASALLAKNLGLKTFIIVTGVEQVCVGFGTPQQRPLGRVTTDEARKYLDAGEFPEGSMGPKIRAALLFLEGGGEEVIITRPGKLRAAIGGNAGTKIVKG